MYFCKNLTRSIILTMILGTAGYCFYVWAGYVSFPINCTVDKIELDVKYDTGSYFCNPNYIISYSFVGTEYSNITVKSGLSPLIYLNDTDINRRICYYYALGKYNIGGNTDHCSSTLKYTTEPCIEDACAFTNNCKHSQCGIYFIITSTLTLVIFTIMYAYIIYHCCKKEKNHDFVAVLS